MDKKFIERLITICTPRKRRKYFF